jgi:hypothetical protein
MPAGENVQKGRSVFVGASLHFIQGAIGAIQERLRRLPIGGADSRSNTHGKRRTFAIRSQTVGDAASNLTRNV